MAALALLAACGGGPDVAPVAVAARGARALASLELPGNHCPAGGARIDAGIDNNANGVLDAVEITSTQYVCDGVTGATGAAGLAGLAGAPGIAGAIGPTGFAALVQMSAELAGAHCANGGTKVSAGSDANANGVLDPAEVSSVAYVCAGADGVSGSAGSNGATGATGATGPAGQTGAAGTSGAAGQDSLMRMTARGASGACPSGGTLVESGLDLDRNGALGGAEVTASTLVCNGSNGAAGSNGVASLLAVVAEPAGVLHCAAAGSRIDSGADANGNGLLDPGEVVSTAYVCNGVAGTNGTNGANGTNGSNGTNGTNGTAGTNGTNGYTTLTVSVAETAGVHCPAGGNKITSGVDTGRDGVLDLGEVTATSYVCNGIEGWVAVSAATVQARSNTGYVANNVAQVTVTLPASPSVGDVVRVSGAGAGGWKIAQNASQSIVTGNLDVATLGTVWTDRVHAAQWRAIASSADGSRLIAAADQDYLSISADAGVTLTQVESPRSWTGVASSADGRRLVAVAYGQAILVSDDYGATWLSRGPNAGWSAVASSADGRVLAAATNGQAIYVSEDYGVNWTVRSPSKNWSSIALSADGSRIVAASRGGTVDVSHDFGVNWTSQLSTVDWRGVASSADGRVLVAVGWNIPIFISADYGATWLPSESARLWNSVTSSADGSRLAAVAGDDPNAATTVLDSIVVSSDQGLTWTPRAGPDSWISVASSADGSRLAAVADGYGSAGLSTSVPTPVHTTTLGTGGSITGKQYQAIELQYLGLDQFMVIDAIGAEFEVQ